VKILIVSDITWGPATLRALQEVVREVSPTVVMVAGDIVDNKSGDMEAFWHGVLAFFTYLSERGIAATYVRGNWDRSPWYDTLSQSQLPFIQNCTSRLVELAGLRILGVPHQFTNDLRSARALASVFPERVDIVLAHAENMRRVWLLRLNARVIVTGHFDEQIAQVRDKLFISTWNFPRHFVVLGWKARQLDIEYRYSTSAPRSSTRRATFSKKGLLWRDRPFADSREYGVRLDALLNARERLLSGLADKKALEQELLALGVLEGHVREYLARPAQPVEGRLTTR
jgi:predicted phosphodiesterase